MRGGRGHPSGVRLPNITFMISALEYAKTAIDPSTPYGYQKMVIWETTDEMGWDQWEVMTALMWLWERNYESECVGAEFRKECNKNGNACWNWQ
jgi:hypothetical protein